VTLLRERAGPRRAAAGPRRRIGHNFGRLEARCGQLPTRSDDAIVPSLDKTLCWEGEGAADARGLLRLPLA